MEQDNKTDSKNHMVINGFTVLQTRFTDQSKTGHYLYVKEHAAKDQDARRPPERTLFVVNIPPYCTKESLRHIFSRFGKILHIHLQDKPTKDLLINKSQFFPDVQLKKGFKVGYIVFRKPASVETVKQLPFDTPLVISTTKNPVLTGVEKWCDEYEKSRVDVKQLQDEIDTYMQSYDKLVEADKKKALEQEGVPDEDGWVTVTRHSKKNKAVPRTEAMESKLTEIERKKKQNMELKNFYTFQSRETKRNEIATLRKKFEEDKQRISLMKAARKFKPY
ncbi:ribosomal RNA-processing protein 7 homolog A-like [Mytilus californianus]|uniref:ribosomal RNA-processing protein 7 homolog A-like n=1 Tax=Mytilus californianus TaxID=6549 RepID=UPI002246C190|nr:ribosomal RNA-processing protein 7 homolog A-like [Mytilus californianus]